MVSLCIACAHTGRCRGQEAVGALFGLDLMSEERCLDAVFCLDIRLFGSCHSTSLSEEICVGAINFRYLFLPL